MPPYGQLHAAGVRLDEREDLAGWHEDAPSGWIEAGPEYDELEGEFGEYPDGENADPARTRPREKKARRRLRLVCRTSAAVLAIAVLLATGFTWGTKRWAEVQFRQVSALDLGSPAIVDAAMQHGDDNFLLVGLDGRPGAEVEDPSGGSRSDTAMIVHIPQDRSRVVVVSLPHDLQVDRPECEAWDQATGRYTAQRGQDQGQGQDQDQERAATIAASAAYRYGGPRCATRVVQQVSGLAINHFVGIEFDGFKAMVDAVGGVQVCVTRPIKDDVLGDVVAKPGKVELTGDQALAFVRASHVAEDPTAEDGRIGRQQKLLSALVRAVASGRTLVDPGRLDHLVRAMAANTFVDNVDAGQLSGLAGALGGLDAGRVTFVTLPTTEAADHRELRREDSAALFRAIIDGTPIAGERPAGGPQQQPGGGGQQVTTVPPEQIKLQVVNGTGQEGLATQIAKQLRSVGFEVVKMDNAPQHADRTVIRYAASREPQALSVAAAVSRAALQLNPAMGGAIEVTLGGDFDGAIESVRLGEAVQVRTVEQEQPDARARLDTLNAADTSCA